MAHKARKLQRHARSLLDSIQEFLTPALYKRAEQARGPSRSSRWSTQPLVFTLLLMTWCCGDSQAERFEAAKGLTSICLSRRRRPGKSIQGFQKALARLPTAVLKAVAAGIRQRLLQLFDLSTHGWVIFGCDGSSMECPRTAELEKRLDPGLKKKEGTPQVWVTALVHLRTGLLWAWRLGKGYNRERSHLQALLKTLPKAALVVADPGFNGYELSQVLTAAGVAYLIRMSGKDCLYTLSQEPIDRTKFESGEMLSWPQEARRAGLPPQRVRLLCVRSKSRKDVWLLTNVLESQRLPLEMASRCYRLRWENEGLFRTFKRTLSKVKLKSRTVRLVHREAEGALLATQLMLAQGASWLRTTCAKAAPDVLAKPLETKEPRCSPRRMLLAIRQVIEGKIDVRDRKRYSQLLSQASAQERERSSRKEKRVWPRRTPHTVPKPPQIRSMSPEERVLAEKYLGPIVTSHS